MTNNDLGSNCELTATEKIATLKKVLKLNVSPEDTVLLFYGVLMPENFKHPDLQLIRLAA